MHPAFMAWWAGGRRRHGCGASAGCGPDGVHVQGGHDGDFGGGHFGVRRPLRFLAYRLDLEDKQVAELARVLDDLKTERAQAAVDERRTSSALAEALAAETFDAAKVAAAAQERVRIAEHLRDAVVRALERIHALLDKDQRDKLAYLIRTGALTI